MIKELQNYLIFDIETVPQHWSFNDFKEKDSRGAELFLKKLTNHTLTKKVEDKLLETQSSSPNNLYKEKGGLFPELAKVVVFSAGLIQADGTVTVHSIYDADEKVLLTNVANFFIKIKKKYPNIKLSGYNIKQFDIPFLSRRMLINGVRIPELMSFFNKKPWEIDVLDLMELWKFGGFDSPSLDLLSHAFGVKSPKEEMSGDQVSIIYYNNQKDGLEKIKDYCEADVRATATIIQKISEIYS